MKTKLPPRPRLALLIAIPLLSGVSGAEPAPFQPTWSSLETYETPEWFRDAKFGIWAHWGPQCEPEHGDWYARNMYVEGNYQYNFHAKTYGHPSKVGFKDIINQWKAEKFDPDTLLAFYQKSGARYFVALANHHDNFDLWNSAYQPWNSVAIGPKKNLIGEWAAAAKKNRLRFGVSVHAARAWSWYEPAQGADKTGPLAGVPYDGKLTAAEGKGQWWDGLNPQDLYAQAHELKSGPDRAYVDKFFRRTRQLLAEYKPDLLYFDDSVLPLQKQDEAAGLGMVADYYNENLRRNGRNEAVVNSKALDENQRKALVYDIERGKAGEILPRPWQTDTCIGNWHYDRMLYKKNGYKTAAVVVPMLADIVSKNGNLLLSVPLRRDGMPDEKEMAIVADIGAWLTVNGEAIYGTRPWKKFGEGPSTKAAEAGQYGGQKDASAEPLTSEDIRFTQSKDGKLLYALVLAPPVRGLVTIRSLATHAPERSAPIGKVQLVGQPGNLRFTRDADGLKVTVPPQPADALCIVLRIAEN